MFKSKLITEYDKERAFAEQREDARAKGFAEGFEKGLAEGFAKGLAESGLLMLFGLVKDGLLTLSQAAEEAHMPEAEFKLQMEQSDQLILNNTSDR